MIDDDSDDDEMEKGKDLSGFHFCIFRGETKFPTLKSILSFLSSRYSEKFTGLGSIFENIGEEAVVFVFENAHNATQISQWLDLCSSHIFDIPIINILRVDEKGRDVLEGLVTDVGSFFMIV